MGFKKVNINKSYQKISLLLLLLLQAGFIRCYIPLSKWLNGNAIYTDDYSFHYADALYKGIYLSKFKMMFGYNPYIRAGSVCNILFSVDNFGWSLFVYLLSFLPSGFSFKLYFILTLLSIPFILYWSSRNFNMSIKESVICSALGTFFLHVSVCADFLYWGTVSYVLSSYFCLLVVSLFYRFAKRGRVKDILWFTVMFAIGVWIHIFSIIHVLIPFMLCCLFCFSKFSIKQHAMVVSSAIVVFLLNSIWLIPCLIFMVDYANLARDNFIYVTHSIAEPLNTYLFLSPKFNEYINVPFPKSGSVDLFLLGAGILGMVEWRKQGHGQRSAIFATTVFFFFLLAYYGSFWDFTASLTPLRFVIFMNLCLAFPASSGLLKLYSLFTENKSLKVKAVFLSVAFYLLGTALANPYLHLFQRKDFRLITSVPPPIETLTAWIRENTSSDGRILVENSDFESGHQYYGTHMPYFFPLMTKREYIGNYSPYALSRDSYATFYWGYLFQRRIEEYAQSDVWPYMNLYNIKWIIVWTDASKKFFDASPDNYKFKKKIDKFFIYEVKRDGNYFIKGQGKIKADINRIELTDLQAEDGEVIISYRWMKYLRAQPEISIDKKLMLKDPGGFIKLTNPPENVVIYTSYKDVFSDWKVILNLFKNRL